MTAAIRSPRMPNSRAAEWISTVIKLSFKPLICREIPIKLAAEMEIKPAASAIELSAGAALANFH
jgi:hypothetical protein